MKITKHHLIIFCIALTLALLVVLTVLLVRNSRAEAAGDNTIGIYYYNETSDLIEAEPRGITDESKILDTAVELLFSDPRNTSLKRLAPEREGFLLGYTVVDNTLYINFSEAYYGMEPLNATLLRASVVWTVTQLPLSPAVEQVRFMVNEEDMLTTRGEPVGMITQANTRINPALSSQRITSRTFTLYFVNSDATGLVKRQYTNNNVDLNQVERTIVQHLIDGMQDEGLYSAIPPETKILDIATEEGTCIVDLSAEFGSKFNSSPGLARLVLLSIVNSLTESGNDTQSNVRRVRFLIESEIPQNFQGVSGINQPFERDESVVLG
ncbi:MAG: GerMN domain-containing protein [Clostridiales bacterium]|jgi:spore germination protein GerM|nr:GerMN domain-containing protein [Clostridiales bacterium]